MAAEHCEQLYATCAAYSVPIEAQVGAMQNLVGDISNRKVAPGAACISLKGTVKQIASALQYVAPCCHIAREVQTITRDGASHISVTYQGFDLRIIPVDLQKDKEECERIVMRTRVDPFQGVIQLAQATHKELIVLEAKTNGVIASLARTPAANDKLKIHQPTLALFREFDRICTTFLDATRQADMHYVEGLNKDAAYVGPAATRLQAFREGLVAAAQA